MAKVRKHEQQWAKENGLKKTDLRYHAMTNGRYFNFIVYQANDGRLYYASQGFYRGVFREYCTQKREG